MSIAYDRVKRGLALAIRALQPVDYFALYACRVAKQNADGTLELVPDDPRMPQKSSVPIRLGIPGSTAKVAVGARVLMGFENGSPKAPVATLWEASGLTELVLGAVANDAVAMAAKVDSALSAIRSTFNSHVHSGVTTGPGSSGVPASLISAPSSVGSVSIKLKD